MSWTLPPNGDIGRIDMQQVLEELERARTHYKLISFLAKLDNRFKLLGPMGEIRAAERYYSKL